ncbi:MAG TPA: 3-dehydroquinate synthase [Polyangiaceae bacterium]|nr:3-dehydroquinate synthase [Polyangiaceae bacterium]
MTERRHVVLWGPPGSGKSTLGLRLAGLLGRPFVDIDASVEARLGKAIPELFAAGEVARFRDEEARLLREALASPTPAVISPGGGALVSPVARAAALDAALVVGLACPRSVRVARLRADAAARPLLGDATEERLAALEAERRVAYATSHVELDASGAADDVAARIALALEAGVVPLRVGDHAYAARMLSRGGVPAALRELVANRRPSSTFIVTDETVATLHPELVDALPKATRIVLTPGEDRKRLAVVEEIAQRLADADADRSSLLVAIGGGVVSDLGGLAASLFARGIAWVAVPTTLLSMVDASLGGKTGANLTSGKNLVGTFHHPRSVLVDPDLSATESARALASGLAEAVKTALVGDAALLDLLEASGGRSEALRSEVVRRCLAVKARIVESDPFESGARALLNFGHTFGHAIEASAGFGSWTHGEAVAAGMCHALEIGQRLGATPSDLVARVRALLSAMGLPATIESSLLAECHRALRRDKKRAGNDYRFVVVSAPGHASTISLSEDALVSHSLAIAASHEFGPRD